MLIHPCGPIVSRPVPKPSPATTHQSKGNSRLPWVTRDQFQGSRMSAKCKLVAAQSAVTDSYVYIELFACEEATTCPPSCTKISASPRSWDSIRHVQAPSSGNVMVPHSENEGLYIALRTICLQWQLALVEIQRQSPKGMKQDPSLAFETMLSHLATSLDRSGQHLLFRAALEHTIRLHCCYFPGSSSPFSASQAKGRKSSNSTQWSAPCRRFKWQAAGMARVGRTLHNGHTRTASNFQSAGALQLAWFSSAAVLPSHNQEAAICLK